MAETALKPKAKKPLTVAQIADAKLRREHPDQWRAGKLKMLANRRVPRVCKMLRHIGNLAAYKPSAEQAAAIIEAVQGALNAARMKLAGQREAEKSFAL